MTNAHETELSHALSCALPQIVFFSDRHNQARFKMAVQMANTLDETAQNGVILFV